MSKDIDENLIWSDHVGPGPIIMIITSVLSFIVVIFDSFIIGSYLLTKSEDKKSVLDTFNIFWIVANVLVAAFVVLASSFLFFSDSLGLVVETILAAFTFTLVYQLALATLAMGLVQYSLVFPDSSVADQTNRVRDDQMAFYFYAFYWISGILLYSVTLIMMRNDAVAGSSVRMTSLYVIIGIFVSIAFLTSAILYLHIRAKIKSSQVRPFKQDQEKGSKIELASKSLKEQDHAKGNDEKSNLDEDLQDPSIDQLQDPPQDPLRNSSQDQPRDLSKYLSQEQPQDLSQDQFQNQSQDQSEDLSKDSSQDQPKDQCKDQLKAQPEGQPEDQRKDCSQVASLEQSQDLSQEQSQVVSQEQPQDLSQEQSQDLLQKQAQDLSQEQPQGQSQYQSQDQLKEVRHHPLQVPSNEQIQVAPDQNVMRGSPEEVQKARRNRPNQSHKVDAWHDQTHYDLRGLVELQCLEETHVFSSRAMLVGLISLCVLLVTIITCRSIIAGFTDDHVMSKRCSEASILTFSIMQVLFLSGLILTKKKLRTHLRSMVTRACCRPEITPTPCIEMTAIPNRCPTGQPAVALNVA